MASAVVRRLPRVAFGVVPLLAVAFAAGTVAFAVVLLDRSGVERDRQVQLVEASNGFSALQELPWTVAVGRNAEADLAVRLFDAEQEVASQVRLSGVSVLTQLYANYATFAAVAAYRGSRHPNATVGVRLAAEERQSEMPVVDALNSAATESGRQARTDEWMAVVLSAIVVVLLAAAFTYAFLATRRWASRQRKAAAALRESEEMFRAAFDNAAVATLLISPEGGIRRANATAHRLLGYSDRELESLDAIEITHPDDRAMTQQTLTRCQTGDLDSFQAEKRYLRRDGEPVWVSVAVAPVRTQAGELRSLVIQAVDLTARRAAEEKFRMVFERAGIGISVGAEGMLTETNPAYQRLLGYSGEELSRMHYSAITHPDDLDADRQQMEELIRGERDSFTLEKRYLNRAGETLWVRVTVTKSPDGSFGIGLIEDISERRRLLARTVEAAEQERLALAADLHDGPIQHLTAAAFNLDLLVSQLARDGNTDAAENARKLRRNVAEEMTSLRQMMTALRPPVIDERGLTAALDDVAITLFANTDISHTVDSNLDGRRVAPDIETALYRVAREALTNIRNHAHAHTVHIELDARQHTLYLTITDDGTGFDTTQQANGHYGLVTMHERTQSLGGTLHIASTHDSGTRIEAVLPLQANMP